MVSTKTLNTHLSVDTTRWKVKRAYLQWENYLRYHDTCINFINLHKPYKFIIYLYKLYSLTFRTHLTFHQFMDFASTGLPSNTLLHLYNNNLVVVFKIKLLLFFFSYVLIACFHIACFTNLRHENSTNPSSNFRKLTLNACTLTKRMKICEIRFKWYFISKMQRVYSKLCQTFLMELFAIIVHGF